MKKEAKDAIIIGEVVLKVMENAKKLSSEAIPTKEELVAEF